MTERRARQAAVRAAFTIAEMLMVIAVIALIAGVGGGLFAGTLRNMSARTAARDLFLAARYARLLAVERQQCCVLDLDEEESGFRLLVYEFNQQTNHTEQVTLRDFHSRPIVFAEGVRFEDIITSPGGSGEEFGDGGRQAVFYPNGTAVRSVIQVGDGLNHYTVSISASTGRAKMWEGTAAIVEEETMDLDMQ